MFPAPALFSASIWAYSFPGCALGSPAYPAAKPSASDAAIARAYGSNTLRRAQRLLTYIEDQGLIVCQLDGAGRRIVTLVELAWATAPVDPNGEKVSAEQGP